MAEGTYSLSDIAAALGGGHSGFGGNGLWIVAILFLFVLMGGGMFGNRQNLATQGELQRGLDNQNSMSNQREILSAITNGTAQNVAAVNQSFHDMIAYNGDKYNEITRDIGAMAVTQANMLANQNQCCCNTLRAIDTVNFNAAQNTAAIQATCTANTQKVLDALAQNKISALEDQVRNLQLQQAVAGMVKYPQNATYAIGTPFNIGVPPFGCGFVG